MSREALLEENRLQKQEIASLKHQLDQLRKMIFGQKRERYVSDTDDPTQLSLFEQEGDQKSNTSKICQRGRQRYSNRKVT